VRIGTQQTVLCDKAGPVHVPTRATIVIVHVPWLGKRSTVRLCWEEPVAVVVAVGPAGVVSVIT
jgi:hypothetical protein